MDFNNNYENYINSISKKNFNVSLKLFKIKSNNINEIYNILIILFGYCILNPEDVIKYQKSIVIIEFERKVYWYYIDNYIYQIIHTNVDGSFENKMEDLNNQIDFQLSNEFKINKKIEYIQLFNQGDIDRYTSYEYYYYRRLINLIIDKEAIRDKKFLKSIDKIVPFNKDIDNNFPLESFICYLNNINNSDDFILFLTTWRNNNLKIYQVDEYFTKEGSNYKCKSCNKTYLQPRNAHLDSRNFKTVFLQKI
ncbi:hypothetical protein ACTFIR_009408 [Dictyostelium discoideum]